MAADLTQLQDAYLKLREKKAKQKELKSSFRDELAHHARYQELLEEMKKLREEKKSIENEVYAQSLAEAQQLDELKSEIKSQDELISDLSFNLYSQGILVEVRDEYENLYEPNFVVRFKKTGDVAKAPAPAPAAEMVEEEVPDVAMDAGMLPAAA